MNALQVLSRQGGFIRIVIYKSNERIFTVIITILLLHQRLPVPLFSVKGYYSKDEKKLTFCSSIDPEYPNVFLADCFQEYINVATIKTIAENCPGKRKIVEFRLSEDNEIEEINTYKLYSDMTAALQEKLIKMCTKKDSSTPVNTFVDSIIYKNENIENMIGI